MNIYGCMNVFKTGPFIELLMTLVQGSVVHS